MIRIGLVVGTAILLSWPGGEAWLPDVAAVTRHSWRERDALLVASRRPARSEPIRVLLIEDDSTIAEMYRLQLDYDGYHVTVVNTGEGAIRALAASRPDIILVDINRAFSDHPPVVILSNDGEPTMIERGLTLGAVEYLVKSRVTPDSVSRAIPGWIDRDDSETPPRQD